MILVPDVLALLDLERGGLFEAVFSCGIAMVIQQFVFDRNFGNGIGPKLESMGLKVVHLEPEEMSQLQAIRSECKQLALEDSYALINSRRPNHVLITDNPFLQSEAKAQGVSSNGLLWLLDLVEISGNVSSDILCEGLSAISANRRCALPTRSITSRLQKWGKGSSPS